MEQTVHKDLQGLQALVVGASEGIGFACAGRLLRAGARVTIAARNEKKLRRAAEALSRACDLSNETFIRWVVCDACNEEQVKAACDFAANGNNGQLDLAVAVVGGGAGGPLALMEKNHFEQAVCLGVVPTFLLIKHATPYLKKAGGGALVSISSAVSDMTGAFMGAYIAGKAALDALIRVAADELAPLAIRVNAVRPGLIPTASTQFQCSIPGYLDAFMAGQSMKRPGIPEDAAAAVHFLASPASSWITGQCINVDGGLALNRVPMPGKKAYEAVIPAAWKLFLP
jgi:NAD(P)-dependent dehydrogenase (short-subunit alcohol dehydrogenase family)